MNTSKNKTSQLKINFSDLRVPDKNFSSDFYSINKILNKIDPSNYYTQRAGLLNQLIKDLELYCGCRDADPWAKAQLFRIIDEIPTFNSEEKPKKPSYKDVRQIFSFANAFIAKTPRNCIIISILKVDLLKALIRDTHPKYICEKLARQIRLSCDKNDERLKLLKLQSNFFEKSDLQSDLFIRFVCDFSGQQTKDTPTLSKRHSALFNSINNFYNYKSVRIFNARNSPKGFRKNNLPLSDKEHKAYIKFETRSLKELDKHNLRETYRWLENYMTVFPSSTVRLNELEQHELLARLYDLSESNEQQEKWIALVMWLMYTLGLTVREVNQLDFGNDRSITSKGKFKRVLRKQKDAGKVAHSELCEPQSNIIYLDLHKRIKGLFVELMDENSFVHDAIKISIKDQVIEIKKHLEAWRVFGRYRLTMKRLTAALPSEISIMTRQPALIFLLACRPHHVPPTTSYYTAVSHKQLQTIWKEAQRGLDPYE